MFQWELKKIFKSKNGIFTFILFFILTISMIFIKPRLEVVNDYNENNQGMTSVEDQFNMKVDLLRNFSENGAEDDISNELKDISNKKLMALKFNEYKDIRFLKVFHYRAFHPLMIFIMLIIIVIIFSNIYTDEIISTVDKLILTSRNKYKVLYSKLALSIITPVILYTTYLILQFIITYIQFGKPINGDLQVLRILDNPVLIKEAYTIYEFIFLKIGIMLILLTTFGVFGSLFSFITTNSIQSTSAFFIFIFLCKVITLIKWLPKEVLMILSKVNYIDLMFNFNEFALMYSGSFRIFDINIDITNLCVSIMITVLLIGIFSCSIIFRKYLTR